MDSVNALILSHARSHVELIPNIAQHLIQSGGKRIRPMLTLASAQLMGYRGEHAVTLAASVEFMHTATLLHDDVVDGSELRRGKIAARMLWGNEATVLVGDYLLGQAFRMMVSTGSLGALRVLSDAAAQIAEGEVWQLAQAKQMTDDLSGYLRVIEAKTATLFAAALEVGPILADADEEACNALRRYGLHLGIAFQLADDALDYDATASKLGKKAGDDFRDGKITMPAIVAFAAGDADERAFWQRTLCSLKQNEGDLEAAIALVEKYQGFAKTRLAAEEHSAKAIAALDLFPDSAMRAALMDAAHFAVRRQH